MKLQEHLEIIVSDKLLINSSCILHFLRDLKTWRIYFWTCYIGTITTHPYLARVLQTEKSIISSATRETWWQESCCRRQDGRRQDSHLGEEMSVITGLCFHEYGYIYYLIIVKRKVREWNDLILMVLAYIACRKVNAIICYFFWHDCQMFQKLLSFNSSVAA